MIPKPIIEAFSRQTGEITRNNKESVTRNISRLELNHNEQFVDFFLLYDLSGIVSKKEVELIDLCSPSDEILETTEWAKEVYELQDDFICLSSGEGEGFILLSRVDGKVYDVSVNNFDLLESHGVEPRWNSFYELIDWYLN